MSAGIIKPIQLTLFQIEPTFSKITIDWLFDYLNKAYPEMKFVIVNDFVDKRARITQTLSKKIELYFHISTYMNSVPNKGGCKFIGFSYGKEYGDLHHRSGPIDTMEEFKNKLPQIHKEVISYMEEYKQRGKKK